MKIASNKGLLILVTFSLIVSIFGTVGVTGGVQASGTTLHAPIAIDKNSDFVALKSSGGCTGSGTVGDPYVISGFEIAGTGTNGSSCIYIGNCTVHVVINNCKTHGGNFGIQVFKSSNVTISDDIVIDASSLYGIYLNKANNNNVSSSVCSGSDHGLFLYMSSNNSIWNNTCLATEGCALCLKNSSSSNTLSHNLCYYSADNGIYLVFSSNNNIITNNTLQDNNGQGVTLVSCGGNHIYGNVFIGNHGNDTFPNPSHHQAYDDGTTNRWNTTTTGNNWSDWGSPDANHDGIVDVPYTIAGGSSEDYLPTAHLVAPGTTLPSAPIGLNATAGNGQVSLSWTAPKYNGNGTIDYYVVYKNGTEAAHPATNSTTIPELTNGITYNFTVAAHNSAGAGAKSNVVFATPIGLPGTPRGLTATPGSRQVTLNWSAPVSNGGVTIDYYYVYQDQFKVQQTSNTSVTIPGLTDGVKYNFTVAAHNSVGTGVETVAVSATPVTVTTVAGAPTGLIVIPGDSNASLSWSAPASNGGAAIDYYVVYENGTALASHYTSNSTIITGLVNGQNYTFAVAAHNSNGVGALSSAVNATLAKSPAVPGVPTDLKATVGNGWVLLSWTAPSNNGGLTIDYYTVYQNGVDIYHATTTVHNVTSLVNGRSYNFTVAAHNSIGTGAATSAVKATPSSGVAKPGVPTDVVATAGNGQVTLSWKAPSGSSGIDYYVVYRNGVDVSHPTNTTATITGLVNGQNYTFAVSAHNSVGEGAASSVLSASPVDSGTTGATAASGNNDIFLYIGILAIVAIIIGVVYYFKWVGGKKK